MIRNLALAIIITSTIIAPTIASENTAIEVPLFYTEKGHPFVGADINDKQNVPMIIDTAAGAGVLPISMKEELELNPDSVMQVQVQGAAGVQVLDYTSIKRTQVENTTVANLPYVFQDLADLALEDGQIPGILGHHFLSQHCVEFDFQTNILKLSKDSCKAEQLDSLRASDFFIEQNFVKVKTQFNGENVDAILDTASMDSYVNDKLQSMLQVETVYTDTAIGLNNHSVEKQKLEEVTFHIGAHKITEDGMYASNMPVFSALGYTDEPVMLLGLNYFKGNKLIIDYYQNKIYY